MCFTTATYKAGAWLAGQSVEVSCDGGLVQLCHRGVLTAPRSPTTTGKVEHPPNRQSAGVERNRKLAPSRPTAASVTR